MCGIAGIMHYAGRETVSFDCVHDMTQTLLHRGPDEEGYYINPQHTVGLGHRRLSIIDLQSGKQPLSNEDDTKHIVFNGEIYNYKELRSYLVRSGHHFKTQTDTEVILHLFEEKGPAAFALLNGVFAVAIFDEQTQTLTIARDRFGVKPLYYSDVQGSFCFGSEIKAILAAEISEREIDLCALDTFLDYRFNPSPQTLFKNIHKVLPGHIVSVRYGSCPRIFPVRECVPSTNTLIHEEEAVAEYDRLLRLAVQRQMVSDVPVGVLLSGGIDSAIIAHHMSQHSTTPVQSYTIGFEGKGDYNELDDARRSAELLGTNHHEMLIGKRDYLDFFEKSFYYLEEPIAMTTVPAMFYVSRFAAQDVKVVLAGQGADEPLAGYPRYRGEKFISDYGWLLQKLPLEKIASLLPRNEQIKRLAYSMKFDSEVSRFHAIHTIFHPQLKQRLLLKDLQDKIGHDSEQFIQRLHGNTKGLSDSLSRLLYIDTRLNLPDNLLLFNDKMSMANSLEMRVPFLDYELVDFLESLPTHLKIRANNQKYIHKKTCLKNLPLEIVKRKKRGFGTPMDEWLQGDFAKTIQRLFNESDSGVRNYFNLNTINQMILMHHTKRENYQRQLFALLSFELWHRNFFTQTRTPSRFESEDAFTLRS